MKIIINIKGYYKMYLRELILCQLLFFSISLISRIMELISFEENINKHEVSPFFAQSKNSSYFLKVLIFLAIEIIFYMNQ